MKLSVWKIGTWKPSQYEHGDNLVVVFKGIDKNNLGKTYKLNLNSLQPNKDNWLAVIREGNVLNVDVFPGTHTVNKKGHFYLVNVAPNGKESVDEEGQLPGQLKLI